MLLFLCIVCLGLKFFPFMFSKNCMYVTHYIFAESRQLPIVVCPGHLSRYLLIDYYWHGKQLKIPLWSAHSESELERLDYQGLKPIIQVSTSPNQSLLRRVAERIPLEARNLDWVSYCQPRLDRLIVWTRIH